MSNLSNDSRDSVARTPAKSQTETAPLEVLITFNDGARFQFQISVPNTFFSCAQDGATLADWATWFSEQKFLPAYEISRRDSVVSGIKNHVSQSATFINMANVSQIRELPL